MKANPLSVIEPMASMAEAWAEADRLRAEVHRLWLKGKSLRAKRKRRLAKSKHPGVDSKDLRGEGYYLWLASKRLIYERKHLRAKSAQVVIVTAQALYGRRVKIDWEARTANAPA